MVTPLRLIRPRFRTGFTLMEMAFAMSVAAVWCVMTLVTITKAMQMRREAEQMKLASTLAEAKMAQLLSRPDLETTEEEGNLGESGPFARFEYRIKITEEQIDLAAATEEGKLTSVNVDDRLDTGVQNGNPRERAGQGAATETGGLVDINRIILVIRFPIGDNRTEELRVETFKAAAKTIRP